MDKINIAAIWDAIVRERHYQDGRFGPPDHTIPGWVLILRKQLDNAVDHWFDEDTDKALTEILHVIAVGFSCLEQHGVPSSAFRVYDDARPVSFDHWTCHYCLHPNIPGWVKYCGNCGRMAKHIKDDVEAENDKSEAEEKVVLEEVVVQGFEQYTVYEVGQGYTAIRISDLDEDLQDPLRRFMRGQTQVLIVGYPMDDFVFLHDFQNFLASGKLFWD